MEGLRFGMDGCGPASLVVGYLQPFLLIGGYHNLSTKFVKHFSCHIAFPIGMSLLKML
jgi:hypothetical protein